MHMRKKSVYQQTQALLCKNLLEKWRNKRAAALECGIPLLLGLYLGLFSYFNEETYFPGMPPQDLGRVDKFNSSSVVAYTPVSDITQKIMNQTVLAPFLKGKTVIGVADKAQLDEIIDDNLPYAAGIIFNDMFSYNLNFFQGFSIPFLNEDVISVHCWKIGTEFNCLLDTYWTRGFVPLQAAINSAIIQVLTNHSVLEQLMSVTAINMKTLPYTAREYLQNEMLMFYLLLYFSPSTYFLTLNITKERKKRKDVMKMMGLQDSAFWLSWGLTYAAFILIFSIIITTVITTTSIISTVPMVVFILFFLYGSSLIALTFLMCVLIKKTALTNLAIFSLTIFWGGVGFTVYYRHLPSALEWIFCIFSPFAFISGITQMIHQEFSVSGVTLPDPSGHSYKVIAIFSILAFDTLLYLILALYFDKILSYGNKGHFSPIFFLSSSSCFQHQRANHKIIENETDTDTEHPPDDYFEPIPPEYQGKEAIRIRNVTKEYKGKSGKVEALKGLFFDIYEGQITAILGQSGAGKSSLLNILSGLSVPTEGSVTIYDKNISEMQDLEDLRNITGVCPQHNVQIDMLTVKENLRLFAKIRGIQPQAVEQEVQRIILELGIQNIQDHVVQHLNEGQKRKLAFGIAILGDPQVLLLDEPTVGLDPSSRHQVWTFLKEHKEDRVILLSTNFTDEADILADRKVIMSNGRLMCAGSSVFLKRRWGLGYNLSLYRNELCDPEKITSFINHHIPEAKLKAESKEKLVYTLPLERTDAFPGLLSDLDKGSSQGVISYDVSMSTLSDIFMKLEGGSPGSQDFEHTEVMGHTESLPETEPDHSSPTAMRKAVSAMGLWRMQVCAIARLRFLKLKHGRKELLTLLLVFGISVYPYAMERIIYNLLDQKNDWEFKPELYFLSPGQLPQETRTSLLIINNTESNIEDFIEAVKQQNILLEVDDFENRNGTEDLSYNGAIIVSGKQKDYRFSVVCNTKRLHCFPILMHVISNGLLGMLNHKQYIRMKRSAVSLLFSWSWFGLPESSVFFFVMICSISPYIAMSSVSDYQKSSKSQLWISGLFPSAYWFGHAMVDVPIYIFILLCLFIILNITTFGDINQVGVIVFAWIITLFGFATSLVFLTYVISFIFRKRRKNSALWSIAFYFVLFISLDIVFTHQDRITANIVCMIFIPPMVFIGFIMVIAEKYYQQREHMDDSALAIIGPDFLFCLVPYAQTLLFIFILRCLEMKYGKKIMQRDPVFRISPQRGGAQQNPEHPGEEDEDVQAERTRTAIALTTSTSEEKPVILASCLHKEYVGSKKSCCARRKKKAAIRNISFCVQKGEIFGLLGPSGAGKSLSMKMLSGAIKPTAGEVELNDCRPTWDQQGDSQVKFLGYCPQENVLWANLTVKEHLEVFATVKGLNKEDTAILRLVDAFQLHEQLNVPVCKLTTGAARKLCFLLSILGDSPILLLDKPSSGVDPVGQQQMWRMIQGAVKSTGRGALLITHHLAEAEAVCDRIAIMVSGKLRCIGSIQHLKSKFGKDYILELKVKETSQVASVHAEIVKLFPQAAQQQRYSSFLTYKLPMMDVHPLSHAFHKLEAVKHQLNLDEYSLSQCTLDKVFGELAKEQQLGELDEVDTTIRWRLLPYSDDP